MRKPPLPPSRLSLLALVLALAAPAGAQVALPRLPEVRVPDVGGTVRDLPGTARGALDLAERAAVGSVDRLRSLARAHPRELDVDERGRAVVRGEVLVADPSPDALAAATRAGFRVIRDERLEGLDVRVVALAPPSGLRAVGAVDRLRRLAPDAAWDFNHLYVDAGGAGTAARAALAPAAPPERAGLIDTGVDARHPALAGVRVETAAFAPGGYLPAPHGTAVASILVGRGTTLYAADVYGSTPRGGSAEAVARALAWMAERKVGVVNVSLVGPENAVMDAAIRAAAARGHLIVAAVGNDGPSAPPLYPAASPEVIGVTGVDARRRALPEAGRGPQVDFAAVGAGVAGAGRKNGAGPVRGTSFAAPTVAARLAGSLPRPDKAGAERAVERLSREAVDLGAKGVDPVYGRGLVP